MDRPRLRPLDAFPVEEQGQKLLALRDPSGIAESIALTPIAVAVLSFCNGDNTRDEIVRLFTQRYRQALTRQDLDRILDELDRRLLLDSDTFRQHSASLFADFARSSERPAFLAERQYPAEAAALVALLDSFFTHPNGPGAPKASDRPLPASIVSPHIDFARGGPAYAWAYHALCEAAEAPELVVVFGTNHAGSDAPFTLTKKHYQTPLGPLETDGALVDALATRVGEQLGEAAAQELFKDEHHHRGEHSIEFQAVWLRYAFRRHPAPPKVLPILCGSLREHIEARTDPAGERRVTVLLEAIRALADGRKVLYVAGADLAHVGPRFGDPTPLDQEDRVSLEKRDRVTLDPVLRGDAAGWFQEIAREGDRRNVCGVGPIYAMLGAARPRAGRLLAYGQCAADDHGGSLVSIASLTFE
jgi:hypothetical protein